MALIGTISGSVGVGNSLISATAISGTLIIADASPDSFPALASGVKLFVSGNKTQLGADTPNAIFGGDTFVSGAFGTDSYIQLKPVTTLRIPTNTSASYIYTSGSTNDLYYTQYLPGTSFTNTVRMRWLEGVLTTGLLKGGLLTTTNGTTTFNISAGTGIIVDYNASTTEEPYPTVVTVTWATQTGISLTYAASAQITYIAVDSTGTVVQRNSPYTDGDFNNYIVIGRILHQTGGVTNGTITSPTTAYGSVQASTEFMRAFGPLKITGHALSVNGTATNPPTNTEFLGLAKTAGDSFVEGRNYTSDANDPWYVQGSTDTALTTSKIFREYLDGSGNPVIQTNGGAGYTAIDPTKRYVAGTETSVTSNKFTMQRVYWFPNSVNRALFVYYGVDEYASIADAEGSIESEAFTEGANTAGAAILVGYIIVRGSTTNLNTTTDAKIVQAGLVRGIVAGGGGAGGSTLPAGSDTYVQFNDGGTAFGGDAGLTYNKSTDTLTVAGDIAVDGGDITTSATTFNLVNTTATAVNFAGAATALTIGANGTGATTIRNVITASSGKIALTNAAGSLLSFPVGAGAIGAPTLTVNPSAGTKILLYPNGSAGTATDFAMGMESFGMWQSVPTPAAAYKFRWYGGSTEIASLRGDGLLTITGSLATSTGNIIGAPGSGNNVLTLISSGNIVAKLDVDGSAPGHRFEVHDSAGSVVFAVSETGDAEIAGTLLLTGSSLSTLTTTTFNLLNTALTGTLNVSALASTINFGGSITTSSFQGEVIAGAKTLLASVTEKLTHTSSAGSTVNFDLRNNNIFYVTNPITANITANFINTPTTPDRVITPTIILSQSATARIVNGIQVNSASGSILWANNVVPTGNANKQDVFGFSLIRSGTVWIALGQMSTYG